MLILQNILEPSEDRCAERAMYFHESEGNRIYDGYFNILSCKKWSTYTTVEEVFLQVKGTGKFEIEVCSEQGSVGSWTADNSLIVIPLPPVSAQSFVWFVFKPLSSQARLIHAAYGTEQSPVHSVKLAAAICTYRREAYVRQNLQVLGDAILQNPENPLHDLLDVFVIDNGQTLPSEIASPVRGHIYLFPNKNAGGSGGFTRGMLEVLKRKKTNGYTHIILMDDDAVQEPDAFTRCFGLLSFRKDQFRDICVAGALLDLDDKFVQDEMGATYHNGVVTPIGERIDLRQRDTVLLNEEIQEVDYAGWWWACYPLTVVRPDNLPMPFFIHYDDMEYGLRHTGGFLYLNGIAVWHQGFHTRRPQANIFYGVRNRLITNALRSKEITLREELRNCLDEMAYHVLRYQYGTSDLVLQAVQDFVGGPKHFGRIDPEERNSQIRAMADPFFKPQELTENKTLQMRIETYIQRQLNGNERSEHKLVGKKKYIFTLNGWLLPAKIEKDPAICSIFAPDMREMYRSKRTILIDPYAGKGALVEKSYQKAFRSLLYMAKVSWLMVTRYHRAAAAFRREEKRLTGSKFWIKYLDL